MDTKRKEIPYWSFIGMHMASKDEINFETDKPALKDSSHTFTFHIVG